MSVADLYRNRGVNPLAVGSHTPIRLESAVSKANGATNSATVVWEHIVTPGLNQVLVVFIPVSQNATVSSVAYGTAALTLITSQAGQSNAKAYLYFLRNPAPGIANVTVTMSTSLQWYLAGSAVFSGVEQATSFYNVTKVADAEQNKDFTVVCTYAGSYILECNGDAGTINTPASGQFILCGADNRIGAFDPTTVVGNNTQSWTGQALAAYAWVGCEMRNA